MRTAPCLAFCLAASLALSGCAQRTESGSPAPAPPTASSSPPESTGVRIETIATGLDHPWAVALLPEGGFLVTERPGRLRRISADGTLSAAPLGGVPAVFAKGQGGLLDVVLDPGYAANKRVWLSYAEAGENGTAGTAVATATLGNDALSDLRVVYRQVPKLDGGMHFGPALPLTAMGMSSSSRASATSARCRRRCPSCRAAGAAAAGRSIRRQPLAGRKMPARKSGATAIAMPRAWRWTRVPAPCG